MKFGLSLPHIGKLASPDAIRSVAQQAEVIGYDSLWVLERTLVPLKPKVPTNCSEYRLPSGCRNCVCRL